MSLKIKNLKGNAKKSALESPGVFETPFRPDLIKRAVLSEQSKKRQPQGRFPLAGKQVAELGVGPGRGISKIPRTRGKGTHHGNRGTFINSTRGGMLAFPPKVEKKIVEKINKKEKYLALKSAISATSSKERSINRGHRVEDVKDFPIVLEDKVMGVKKASEVMTILSNLGLSSDLERCKPKKVRAGKGKMRGRKYQRKVGPLIVVGEDCDLQNAGKNIPGVQVVKLQKLRVENLAPGTAPGRVTVWTEGAIKLLQEWK